MDDVKVNNNVLQPSTNHGMVDEAEGIWSADIEQSFLEALAIYPPCGRRKIILTDEGKMYGRNELVARYIKIRTGKTRTRKQVSSHLQVLAKRRSKELQSLRNDKAAQQVILERLKQYTSAEIVSMNNEQIKSDPPSSSDNDGGDGDEETKKKKSNSPVKNLLQPIPIDQQPSTKSLIIPQIKSEIPTKKKLSPTVHSHVPGRSRCSSNASSSSLISSGSTASQNPILANISLPSCAMIGDEKFHLFELNVFAELKRIIGPIHPSLIYPNSDAYAIHHHDLLRLHANDIQMKSNASFETISIDQIFDKFPRYDGLKDLFENNPDGSFYLIKFWADVSLSSSMSNAIQIRDESFFTSYTYLSHLNRPIHLSTRLCSFGKQVLEKVETSEHPQRDQYEQFIHRFDRSALCDYMVQFIQKLRSLPNPYLMNSVLEVCRERFSSFD